MNESINTSTTSPQRIGNPCRPIGLALAGLIALSVGFTPLMIHAQTASNETRAEYECVSTEDGSCRCNLVSSEASSDLVLGMTSRASCRIDERTGDLLVTFRNICVFSRGTSISGTGVEFLPSACADAPGGEITPRLLSHNASVQKSENITLLETRIELAACNRETMCCEEKLTLRAIHNESVW